MNRSEKGIGAPPTKLQEVSPVKNRLTFIYLEKCKISREDSAIKAMSKDGYVLIPSSSLLVLMLGPGTSLTHRACELISETGVTIEWVGEMGTRLYGFGKPLTHSSSLLMRQAKIVSTPRLHIEAVKRMYSLRYPDEDLTHLTLQQLRGKEGSRVRKEYLQQAKLWNVSWEGRNYDPGDFFSSDPVNQALSTANACLYGLCAAVIHAMGLSAGLGFIHTGHERSFVYDIADLYKSKTTIPAAFEIGSKYSDRIASRTRKTMRNCFYQSDIVEQMVRDIKFILSVEEEIIDEENPYDDSLFIWDGIRENKPAGIQYFEYDSQIDEV